MDLQGSLIDTRLRIYPSKHFAAFLKALPDNEGIPSNILKLIGRDCKSALNEEIAKPQIAELNNEDIEHILNITKFVKSKTDPDKNYSSHESDEEKETGYEKEKTGDTPEKQVTKEAVEEELDIDSNKSPDTNNDNSKLFLTTSDIDWLYSYIQNTREKGDEVPYLHILLEGANIEIPENEVLKRNPELEARCVKLRAQQEAREYRKMTKTVDNVRMRFPEDSIAYQMKQLNRQLIAIGQFIISIFAGFLFGFRGVEWIVGNLEFGFRLLLGVMCALVIALAEIYFLAKKLNEELNIPETVQLGGPTKFADESRYTHLPSKSVEKEHQE